MIGRGMPAAEIGNALDLSPRTVEVHKRDIKKKLAIQSTAGLIHYAIREGLVRLGEAR